MPPQVIRHDMGERLEDDRGRLRDGPERLAEECVAQAARDGFALVLTRETPVVPDEHHPWLTKRGTWGNVEVLVRHWTAIGCLWVNLRFGLDQNGASLVRYEAKPEYEPLPAGRLPAFNGGFDTHRVDALGPGHTPPTVELENRA